MIATILATGDVNQTYASTNVTGHCEDGTSNNSGTYPRNRIIRRSFLPKPLVYSLHHFADEIYKIEMALSKKFFFLEQGIILNKIYQEHKIHLILKSIFNVYAAAYWRRTPPSKSGFIGAVGRRRKG
jgi:hypothetical protein